MTTALCASVWSVPGAVLTPMCEQFDLEVDFWSSRYSGLRPNKALDRCDVMRTSYRLQRLSK
jgi:hypothetical protein